MNIYRTLSLLAVTLPLTAAFVGCTKTERNEISSTAKEMYSDSRAALTEAWDNVKSFTYEKRDEFQASAKAMTSSMDARINELRANYSESKANAARKAAMEELKNSEADYKAKLAALGNATSATWDSAKQNVIAAWERLEASYHKARAD